MPPILVRLNLPGFSSAEPFRLANAPPSMTGLACAVLEEIGGFTKEELDGIRGNLEKVPLTLLGELCAGQLVELASDAELGVFLSTSESASGPGIIEVRARDASSSVIEDLSSSPSSRSPVQPSAPSSVHPPAVAQTRTHVAAAQQVSAAENFVAGAPRVVDRHAPLQPHRGEPHEADQDDCFYGAQYRDESLYSDARQKASSSYAPADGYHQRPPPTSHTNGIYDIRSNGSGHHMGQHPQARPVAPLASGGSYHEPMVQAHMQYPFEEIDAHTASAPGARPRTPNRIAAPKSRGSSRASTPPCERRMPWEADSNSRNVARGDPAGDMSYYDGQVTTSHVRVYDRLYHEKDDRRRRLEEARLRKIEQEDEDIRMSAQRALRRAPSPQRTSSPYGRSNSASRVGGTRTPPRIRPPLPERTNSAWASSAPAQSTASRRSRDRSAGSTEDATRQRPSGRNMANESDASLLRVSSPGPSPMQNAGSPGPSLIHHQDVSSVASDCAHGLHSVASVGTLGGEDSMCGDAVASTAPVASSDDVGTLKKTVATQQQRIEFLENMHQQALRQLRKSREELSRAQRQRFHEADRVLRLEQLVSEMQAQRFDGDASAQLRWEQWLSRTREIFEDEQE